MSGETRHCPECVRLAEDLERQRKLTVRWAQEASRLHGLLGNMAAMANAATAALTAALTNEEGS